MIGGSVFAVTGLSNGNVVVSFSSGGSKKRYAYAFS